VRFFRPEIEAALAARDQVIASWTDEAQAFEDRDREVLSQAPIDINAAVAALS
jgi:hypothetical protein